MTPEITGGIARALLAAFGGFLASRGLIVDASTLEAVIGAFTVIGTAFWSVWSKRRPA